MEVILLFDRKIILIYILLIIGLISISNVSANEIADDASELAIYESDIEVTDDASIINEEINNDIEVYKFSDENPVILDEKDNTISSDNEYNVEPIVSYASSSSSYNISAPDVEKFYGGSEKLEITVTNYGNPVSDTLVKITINGQSYERRTDSHGIATLGLNLNAGKYYVTVRYGNSYAYSTVTIKETIKANDFTKMYKNGTQYSAVFLDPNGNPLRNTDVTFNINGVFYTRHTDSNGIASMNINLNPNKYILTASNPSTGEKYATSITVLSPIVDNYDLTKYYKSNSQYSVRILDAHGNPAKGVAVTFNIHGKFYERYTNENGYAIMNINLDAGNYIITAQYNGYQRSNNIQVLPILSASDLSMDYQDGSKFRVKLVDGQGKPYADQKVMFNIHGKIYYKYTDENGIATLNINLNPGNYIITTSYNGFKISNKINVKTKEITFTVPSNKIGSSFVIEDSFGKYKVHMERWKGYYFGGLDIHLYDSSGNPIKVSSYLTRFYYNINRVWKWSEWTNDIPGGYPYHRYNMDNTVKVQKISIRLLI